MTTHIHRDCATCDNCVVFTCVASEYMSLSDDDREAFRRESLEQSQRGKHCQYWRAKNND